jgi:ribonuclease P protein component
MRFTLEKSEKLKSKKLIEQLFSEGDRVKSYPFHMVFIPVNNDKFSTIQVGFSVPKRNIKLAVDRNRIKRLMREVYRKNKHLFTESLVRKYIFMLVYTAKDEIKYADLELAIQNVAAKFQSKIKNHETFITKD